MKCKVYQLQRVNEEAVPNEEHSKFNRYIYDVVLHQIGEVETTNEFDKSKDVRHLCEVTWEDCNVSCWDSEWSDGDDVKKDGTIFHPTKHFKGYCNNDIVVEINGELWLALDFGWKKVESIDEAQYRIIYCYNFINWYDIKNKHMFNESEFDKVIEKINEEYEAEYQESINK